MKYEELLARPHFEAVIGDLAEMYGIDRLGLREEIKTELISWSIVKRSTTELDEEQLKRYAKRLSAFYFDQEQRPPDERSELNLAKILLNFTPPQNAPNDLLPDLQI